MESQLCVKCFPKFFHTHLSLETLIKPPGYKYFSNQGSEKVNNMSKVVMLCHFEEYLNDHKKNNVLCKT